MLSLFCAIRVFHKHQELAMVAILASGALLRETKKSKNKMLPQ